jgi:hypothetical protein
MSRSLPSAKGSVGSALIAIAFCSAVTVILGAIEPRLRHWFVLPVTACGIVVSLDALPWLRSTRNLFDPVGIIGAIGVHFFFLAPLLHVYWDYWMPYVAAPPDWRPWLGAMAVLNLAGLLMYRAVIARRTRQAYISHPSNLWQIRRTRFFAVGIALVLATTMLQAWVYLISGGISGYIEIIGSNPQSFAGMGWIFVISEAGPIIGMMLFAVASDTLALLRRPVMIGVALTVFVALTLVFGGLRGSRSNTVWAVFWAAGIVHYRIRSLSRPTFAAALVGLACFMYFYGFYKNVNSDAQFAFSSRADRLDLEAKTGRTIEALLLGDLARSDVQAFELYRLTAARDDYPLAWGRTYVGDLATTIPEWLWPTRPKAKTVEGTNLLFGANAFMAATFVASNVYGIAGELMLNFGPAAVPLGFVIVGLCVRRTDRALRGWTPADARWLVAPVLVNLCFVLLVGDGDNVVSFAIKSLLVPGLLLIAGTNRIRIATQPHVRFKSGRVLSRAQARPLTGSPCFRFDRTRNGVRWIS